MLNPTTETCDQESSGYEPKYKGVRKRKWGKWVSEIRLPNSRERIWLGSFDSPIKAARAFDAAAFCLRGSSAKFNFPDQPPNIPGGRSLSPSEIQAAATHYANLPHSYSHHYFESSSGSVADIAGRTETYNSAGSSSSFLLEDNESHVTDYGIFPGFDDYFMQPPPNDSPQYTAYEEENSSYGDISQGPSFLWNF
nr:ethylene-responsive transcription factor ERF017-like [Tanacetum cinerariifolium]